MQEQSDHLVRSRPRRIVVTGASGSAGTALIRALRAPAAPDPEPVLAGVARRRPTPGDPYDAVSWTECDIGGDDALEVLTEAFSGADAVVHLAWAVHPATDDPDRARTNVTGSANVLAAAARVGVLHVVAASSVAAYAPAPRWQRVDEDWPRTGVPGSAYSAEKAGLERMLDDFAHDHPQITLARIRPSAIVQADAGAQFTRWVVSPLVPRVLLGRTGLPVPLWRDLRVQAVHADDVADAICRILSLRAGGAFNLAAEPVLGSADLASIFGGFRLGTPLAVLENLARVSWSYGVQPLHPGWFRLADQAALVRTDPARSVLGWSPRYDSSSAMAELARGIRAGQGTTSHPLRPDDRWMGERVRLGRPTTQSQTPEERHSRALEVTG